MEICSSYSLITLPRLHKTSSWDHVNLKFTNTRSACGHDEFFLTCSVNFQLIFIENLKVNEMLVAFLKASRVCLGFPLRNTLVNTVCYVEKNAIKLPIKPGPKRKHVWWRMNEYSVILSAKLMYRSTIHHTKIWNAVVVCRLLL